MEGQPVPELIAENKALVAQVEAIEYWLALHGLLVNNFRILLQSRLQLGNRMPEGIISIMPSGMRFPS
jgi:hypothetical protein